MKSIKISLLIISILLIFTLIIPISNADPSIIVYDYEFIPKEFMPGDHGTLKLTIKNAETTNTVARTSTSTTTTTVYTDTVGAELLNIWIDAASDSNGRQLKATLNYENVGYLAPSASFDITFEIIAESGLSEGIYFPILNVDIDSFTDVSFPIPINVSNSTIDMVASSFPSKISASGSTQISFNVINNRQYTVDNVVITPAVVDGVEFTPKSYFIGSIEGGSSEEATFSVKPNTMGIKNLQFNVSYKNGNNVHVLSLDEEIEVISSLDVGSVFTKLPRSIKKGSSSRITLEVYNAKTESITGVMVTPISNNTILPTQYFIGAMDPDDVFSASFDIFTDELDIGTHTIDFEVSFKQDSEYFKTPAISSTFLVSNTESSDFQYSRSESENTNQGPLGGLLGICIPVIVVIIVVIALFLIWRWKRRTE